jgi:hypothetical protein
VLDEGVGAQGGGITHRIHLRQDLLKLQPQHVVGLAQRFVETERQVVVGGQRLGFNVLAIPDHETIGERPTDIYRYAPHTFYLLDSLIPASVAAHHATDLRGR